MADFRPTASQEQAMTLRGSTLLVSAGAGSGKTKVLTERLMNYITDPENPADIDSFLIITFTRAAAGELRGRIMEEISASLAADPTNKRLRRQSALCTKAQIGTIHSFCSNILRENSHLIGISPEFKILDDDRAAAMKAAALDRVLEKHYSAAETFAGFRELADTVGVGRDDSRLAKLVLTLHEKMQGHARPGQWAQAQVEMLTRQVSDVSETEWGRELMSWAKKQCSYWGRELDRLMEAMRDSEKISKAYMPGISAAADDVRELGRRLDIGWDAARELLPIQINSGRLVGSPDPELSDMIKARRTACKKALDTLAETFYSDSAALVKEMSMAAPAMTALLELTLAFDREYAANKRRAGLMDYSDLEHFTAQLLTDENGDPTALARAVSGRYTEIMVDEYQDVSRVQDAIFHAVSRRGENLFLVGDVKQSIYRFRLAEARIFTEKYNSFRDADKAEAGQPRRILLRENFRSRREILECANSVFSTCMSEELGDIRYDSDAALICGAAYEGEVPKPELLLMSTGTQSDEGESPDKTALEAGLVAEKIREMMAQGVTVSDKGRMRPLEYGDIAILMRSANSVGGIYRRVLSSYDIPAANGQGSGFFTSMEISTLISALAVIDNPHQDIPLIAVLRFPSVGMSADELSEIRACDREGDFYSALCACAHSSPKAAIFLEKLSRLRSFSRDAGMGELIWEIYNELDMPAVVSAMADGELRRANLLEMLEMTERFEQSGTRGLHRFVLWLRRLAERGNEPSVGAAASSCVQILTVHKSKGLEFPVVFLCDTARKFNLKDNAETVLVHHELGLGPKVTDLKRRVEYPTLARSAIKQRTRRETLSEEMRLLYVALTRAKERLIMTAALPNPEKTVENARAAVTVPMEPEAAMSAQYPANWLIFAAIADGGRHMSMKICSPYPEKEAEAPAADAEAADPEEVKLLRERLSRVYPFEEASALPSKVTATELKDRAEPDEDAGSIAPKQKKKFRMPDFERADRPLAGTGKGIATHLVLQNMELSAADSLASIQTEICRLADKMLISEREAQAVDAMTVYRLFTSPLGRRILGADRIKREFKFSLLCDAQELFGRAKGEQVLLQGVVDCCIEENGKLVIIDYKTDRVESAEDLTQRTQLYTPQLRAYAAALRRIFGMEVSEAVLYFISSGSCVSIDLQ